MKYCLLVLGLGLVACGDEHDVTELDDEMTRDGGASRDAPQDAQVVPKADAGPSTNDGGQRLGNGAECTTDVGCLSGDCSQSVGGKHYCYGGSSLGDSCATTFDCGGGVCAAGVCTDPSSLLSNGAICSAHAECASATCGVSVAGDRFCYGHARLGEECAITQDCDVGVCKQGVCADPNMCTVDAECAINATCAQGRCKQVCGANAVASAGSCQCLPGFEWASRNPDDTSCVRPAVLPGCHVVAQDGARTYLGFVGSCYAANSICNEYGSYGSEYSSTSIFNAYGQFGSSYGGYSAFNSFSASPPLLVCDGKVSGCLTTNSFASCSGGRRTSPLVICGCN